MEQTFMTIHNLSPDANILFASESVVDILGWQPQNVQGKSSFDYFHPDEVPFARSVHSRGVLLDKAAVLHYARILSRDGQWISCECCFTVVHDVLVACTSIYRRGERSQRRAYEAPQIRRIFSSSPRDPRYHMLEHLSPKFKMQPMEREPRAALILNRFTRTLNVMFATDAVASILGVEPDQIQNKSFYECIAENCLADAIKCLESAKANDSIAYLRFWYRDPRRDEDFEGEDAEESLDEESEEMNSSNSTDSDGGVHLDGSMDVDANGVTDRDIKTEATSSPEPSKAAMLAGLHAQSSSSSSSAGPSRPVISPATPPFQAPADVHQPRQRTPQRRQIRRRVPNPTFELEAVVSCTSDGLVVVLRKARPPIPSLHPPSLHAGFENGLFAAPWGAQPVRPYYPPELFYTFQPPLLPQYMPLQEHVKASGGPPLDQLMKSIQDVAVFAWGIVGINGNLATYGRGVPKGESQPADGLPVWDPTAPKSSYLGPESHRPSKRWGSPSFEKPPAKSAPAPALAPGPPYVPGFTAEGTQGYGHTPMGFTNMNTGRPTPPLWPSPAPPYTPATESWAHRQRQQPPPPVSTAYHHSPPEPWTGAAATYTQQNANDYTPPTSQAQSPGDASHDSRYVWQ
ncbi:Uu.00g051930.m01.CDS01 [Anthostomella pinea]|uniref:Uu.00g051930.m01.CDS01 n=1 Tax=Anthostomella pinea TaxID=933095 RepID=A0AAI8VXC9_9PEZI|nr:Uu.00g051930.m01.CDS01 [Anthostomella pinea]